MTVLIRFFDCLIKGTSLKRSGVGVTFGFGVLSTTFLLFLLVGTAPGASPLWPFRFPSPKKTAAKTVSILDNGPQTESDSVKSGFLSIPPNPPLSPVETGRKIDVGNREQAETRPLLTSHAPSGTPTGPSSLFSDTDVSPSDSPESSSGPILLPYHEVLGQVVCQSDFPLDDMESIRTEIQDLQRDLIDYLGVPEPKEKIEICVFRERKSYVDFLRVNCPQAPLNRPALYVKDQGPGYVFLQLDKKLILNLRHEMTHAFLNSTLKNVPIWLDEGLAKYFETPAGERGKANPFLLPVADRAESIFVPVPSLPGLEKLTGIEDMGPTQYRNAWAWTHFLIHYSPETQRILGLYLQSLRPENQTGIDAERAAAIQKTAPLTALLKSEIPDYKKQYRSHFIDWAKR